MKKLQLLEVSCTFLLRINIGTLICFVWVVIQALLDPYPPSKHSEHYLWN